MEHFFSPNSGEDQTKTKKKSSQEMDHFFPRIQVQTCAQMHTRVKLLQGMQVKTILKLLVGIPSNYWGEYFPPYPPGFGTPAWIEETSYFLKRFVPK